MLSLAPFTPNPKIVFNDVVVGTTQIRQLLIKNLSQSDVHVSFTVEITTECECYNLQLFVRKPLPSELNLSLSWDEIEVNQNEEVLLELTWTPTVAEACRHTFTLSDGRKINRDIAVILKSVNPKVSATVL